MDIPMPDLASGWAWSFAYLFRFFYTIIGGLLGMLMAWIYNVVAGWVGGIEFEVG